jgi:ribokinase
MLDVITFGSSTIDIFVGTGNRLFGKAVHRGCVMVPFGSKVLVNELRMSTGGGGTNTAVCMSNLGLKVAYLGKMGKGANSERVLEELKKAKVDTSLVCREKGRTGLSVIIDAKGHDRTILAFKGSNDDLGWNDIKTGRIRAKWLYCSSMMGKSFKTLEKLVAFARKRGIKVAFNPSSYLAKMGIGHIMKIVKNTNLLVMNREEANYLAKTMDVERAAKKLCRYGPEIVVITDGKRGVHACDGRKMHTAKPHKIKVMETTGAGDAFAGSFLAGLIKGKGIKFSLKLGLANAESVITHYGAKEKLLTWKEAVKKIR